MADIAKLSVGREAYTRELAENHEEYLSGHGESPGRWYGAGASSLGLEGEASVAGFQAMFGGRDPTTGELLGRPHGRGPGHAGPGGACGRWGQFRRPGHGLPGQICGPGHDAGAGASLAEAMSDYLVREIEAAPNIVVRYQIEVVGGHGNGHLTALTLKDRTTGTTETVPATALFILIGAEPHTDWLPEPIRRDRWGFVLTGTDLLEDGRPPAGWPLERPPTPLETSLPGVFAVGDVRHGSTKRVASAVGEGSIAIRLIHEYLSQPEA